MNLLKKLYYKFKLASYLQKRKFERVGDKPIVFIFLAADYGNLGDVAITYAQKAFLKKHYPNHEVIEVGAGETLSLLHSISSTIKNDDIITIVGGGNMGDLYGDIELLRLLVVKSFPNNKIILFPQTLDYSNSQEARWLKNLSVKIYSSHNNLLMMAREKRSWREMKKLYPNANIQLTPDIVMTLKQDCNVKRKNLAILCLREDKEKSISSIPHDKIITYLNQAGVEEIEKYDTHIGGNRYTEQEKYKNLFSLWHIFSTSKMIITDRLHGMIFAYITGTPAIVFPNSNFKVRECYEWIKNCGYVFFMQEPSDFSDYLDKIKTIPEGMTPPNEHINKIFDDIMSYEQTD